MSSVSVFPYERTIVYPYHPLAFSSGFPTPVMTCMACRKHAQKNRSICTDRAGGNDGPMNQEHTEKRVTFTLSSIPSVICHLSAFFPSSHLLVSFS